MAQGIVDVLTKKVYWKYLGLFALIYVILAILVGFVLYLVALPLMTMLSFFLLGPFSLILAHIEWFILTMLLTQLLFKNVLIPNLSFIIFKISIIDNFRYFPHNKPSNSIEDKINTKTKKVNSMGNKWFNQENDFFWLFKVSLTFRVLIKYFTMTLISTIPVVGPIIVILLNCEKRALGYLKFYFNWKKISDQELRELVKTNSNEIFWFGLTTGVLEFIPIVNIITIMSNIVGATKFGLSLDTKKK